MTRPIFSYYITHPEPGVSHGVCNKCQWFRAYTRRDSAVRGVKRHLAREHGES